MGNFKKTSLYDCSFATERSKLVCLIKNLCIVKFLSSEGLATVDNKPSSLLWHSFNKTQEELDRQLQAEEFLGINLRL